MEDCVPKFTIPSPALFYFVQNRNRNDVYDNEINLFHDIIKVYRAAIKAFYNAGGSYLQLDDTSFGTLCSTSHREHLKALGQNPDYIMKKYVDLY